MSKKKNDKIVNEANKEFLVMSASINEYEFFDHRANKPISYINKKDEGIMGKMVLQEIESLKVHSKSNDTNPTDYFSPNNVGVLLSIAQKSLLRSQKIINEKLAPQNIEEDKNKKDTIVENSIIIYDYIEEIQTCIVFGYTALEAFSNLSIPNEYVFKTTNNKGIIEIFDKNAIERWTSLNEKISTILVEIYRTKSIKGTKLWNDYVKFENLRNEIIHQKAINSTTFYKKYFHKDISSLCNVPKELIKFFFNERENKRDTNPLWPWIINEKNDFPVSYNFKPDNFEVIGNLFEGRQLNK